MKIYFVILLSIKNQKGIYNMKKFLRIFIFLQIAVMLFIFERSFYDIYEKNNIGDRKLEKYVVIKSNGEKLSKVYDNLYKEMPQKDIQLIRYKNTDNNKSLYLVKHTSVNNLDKRNAVSKNVFFQYKDLKKEDFIDSNGIFYTNISKEKLKKTGAEIGIDIKSVEKDRIPYRKIIDFNIYNFSILIIISYIIYLIYISSKGKEIGLKKSLGYSSKKIVANITLEIIRLILYSIVVVGVVRFSILGITNKLSVQYIALFSAYYSIIILMNAIIILLNIFFIKIIPLSVLIKNSFIISFYSKILVGIKYILIILTTITIASFLTAMKDNRTIVEKLKKYRSLENYHTMNGFFSEKLERTESNRNDLVKLNKNIKKFYNNQKEEAYLIDSSELIENIGKEFAENKKNYSEYKFEYNYIVANNNYLKNFSKYYYKEHMEDNDVKLLVPEEYRKNEKELKNYFKDVYNSNLKYEENFGLESETNKIENIKIKYIKNNKGIEILTDNGFENIKNKIVIIDDGEFAGMKYFDLMGNSGVFFHYNNREELTSKLLEYDLSDLLIQTTLLTPYLEEMENENFILQTTIIFTTIFLFSLMFIIFVSNYVYILAKRKEIASKHILGYTFKNIFKGNIVISIVLLLGSILSIFYSKNIGLSIMAAVTLDYIILIVVYRLLIVKNIPELQKGA